MKRALVVGLLFASAVAHADSKAWRAARRLLPAKLMTIGGLNLTATHNSSLYPTLVELLRQKAGDVAAHLDEINTTCGIDPLNVIDSIAFGMDATGDKAALVIAFRNTNRRKLESCLQQYAQSKGKTVAAGSAAPLAKYTGLTDKGDVFVRWLGPDVVAISATPYDQAATLAATSGGFAKVPPLKALAKVNTNASVWAVSAKETDFGPAKIRAFYGSANLIAGTVKLNARVTTENPPAASALAAGASAQLGTFGQQAEFAELTKTIKITATGSDLIVTAAVPEDAVLRAATTLNLIK